MIIYLTLFLTPVTAIEVNDLINILNPSKSVGPNSIPIKLLKIIGYSVSPLLVLLVNQSVQSGVFPNKLRIAKVISNLKVQGHVTVNKPIISMIYIVAHTWPLCSAQVLVDGVNPQ